MTSTRWAIEARLSQLIGSLPISQRVFSEGWHSASWAIVTEPDAERREEIHQTAIAAGASRAFVRCTSDLRRPQTPIIVTVDMQ